MSGEIKLTSRNALRVLRPGPFRRYIIGSAISDTGTWMQVMTQGWVMATLTTSAFMLGLVNLCAGLPMLALTMVGGSAADKFDKRRSEEHTSELQSRRDLVCRLLLEKKNQQS